MVEYPKRKEKPKIDPSFDPDKWGPILREGLLRKGWWRKTSHGFVRKREYYNRVWVGICVRQRNTWIMCVKVSSYKNIWVYFSQGSFSTLLPVLGRGSLIFYPLNRCIPILSIGYKTFQTSFKLLFHKTYFLTIHWELLRINSNRLKTILFQNNKWSRKNVITNILF